MQGKYNSWNALQESSWLCRLARITWWHVSMPMSRYRSTVWRWWRAQEKRTNNKATMFCTFTVSVSSCQINWLLYCTVWSNTSPWNKDKRKICPVFLLDRASLKLLWTSLAMDAPICLAIRSAATVLWVSWQGRANLWSREARSWRCCREWAAAAALHRHRV